MNTNKENVSLTDRKNTRVNGKNKNYMYVCVQNILVYHNYFTKKYLHLVKI